MDDKELIAAKLGFLSAEEMEAYHDLCRGYFEDGTILTKDLCEKHVKGYELDKLLHMPREQRLEEKIYYDFGGLVECVKLGDTEKVQYLKSLIDSQLFELDKCYTKKDHKTMK